MTYENNVYAFPQGGPQEREPEQPQFLPADVGAETLDAYINFRQTRAAADDMFQSEDYQEVGQLLQRLWPVFATEGEVGIYAKLAEIHNTLKTGASFERDTLSIKPEDDPAIQRALQLIELAREDKVEFLKWQNSPEISTEQSPGFPTDAIGQSELAVEYFFSDAANSATEKTKTQLLAGLDMLYRIRPLTEGENTTSVRERLEGILETLLNGNTFSEEDVVITPYSIKMIDAALEIATYTETHADTLQSWHANALTEKKAAAETNFPANPVGQIEIAAEYLFIQTKDTATSAQREQMLAGLDIIEHLRPVFDSISGYSISEAITKILETVQSGYDFERAGVRMTSADTHLLEAANALALFTENNQKLLQDWYSITGQTNPTPEATTANAVPENTTATEIETNPTPANTIDSYTAAVDVNAINNTAFNEKNEPIENQEDGRTTIDQVKELKQFMSFLNDTTGTDYSALRTVFKTMEPIFKVADTQSLTDLFTSLLDRLSAEGTFSKAGVIIEESQRELFQAVLDLIPEIEKQRDAFDQWKVEHPDTEEEEETAEEVIGEQLFGAVASVAAETALTETWKNQTRHFSEEMSKLQKEVTTRRLEGLPHIFPPDFESIVGQFIYRLNRVTEFKPTMMAEFESEFGELLAYFDLRMLRTAGEELDQELPDDAESLELVNKSLKTIDEQLTNLMLLQTSQTLIRELRNVKYRLDLLMGKVQNSIAQSENNEQQKAA